MGGFGGLCHQLEVCVRVDVQVVVEGNVRVQGGVNAACSQQLDGFFQRVDTLHGSTVAFSQLHVGGSQTVGGGLADRIISDIGDSVTSVTISTSHVMGKYIRDDH